jgi:L-seryl-tRNA(Ser) seleniumtransferase
MDKKKLLLSLPAVDEIVKSKVGIEWLRKYPRVYAIRAIREIIQRKRKTILGGKYEMDDPSDLLQEIERIIEKLSGFNLQPVINATGVVIHTNLGRSVLSEEIMKRVSMIAGGYSNLEYDIDKGERDTPMYRGCLGKLLVLKTESSSTTTRPLSSYLSQHWQKAVRSLYHGESWSK